jgi:hypothetical protein
VTKAHFPFKFSIRTPSFSFGYLYFPLRPKGSPNGLRYAPSGHATPGRAWTLLGSRILLKRRKMFVNREDSPPSAARFVSPHLMAIIFFILGEILVISLTN